MARWFRFFIAIGFGLGLGLAYGWIINPVQSVDITPDTLRIDYKTDYVLMVAEAFQEEQDLPVAIRRLAVLGDSTPAEFVYQAIEFAQKSGYIEPDIARMQALLSALQNLPSEQGSAP